MSEDSNGAFTKRSVLRTTGTALAASVGVTGLGSAECGPPSYCCDDYDEPDCADIPWFCGGECVQTTEEAEAYSICPFDAVSHETYIEAGRTGFVGDTCSDGCYNAVKADFDCSGTWWVRANDVKEVSDSYCLC
jgi:hypothetical protein